MTDNVIRRHFPLDNIMKVKCPVSGHVGEPGSIRDYDPPEWWIGGTGGRLRYVTCAECGKGFDVQQVPDGGNGYSIEGLPIEDKVKKYREDMINEGNDHGPGTRVLLRRVGPTHGQARKASDRAANRRRRGGCLPVPRRGVVGHVTRIFLWERFCLIQTSPPVPPGWIDHHREQEVH
jgi:hypothetical protein